MMEMQWGGGAEGAACFDIFRKKSLVCFAGARFGWRSKQQ
jgi:hypothetical protein